jgi:hypothetical protein
MQEISGGQETKVTSCQLPARTDPPRTDELCRDRCRRSAAHSNFPLYPGLTPGANTNAAASRLGRQIFEHLIPPQIWIRSCDTVSEVREGRQTQMPVVSRASAVTGDCLLQESLQSPVGSKNRSPAD